MDRCTDTYDTFPIASLSLLQGEPMASLGVSHMKLMKQKKNQRPG